MKGENERRVRSDKRGNGRDKTSLALACGAGARVAARAVWVGALGHSIREREGGISEVTGSFSIVLERCCCCVLYEEDGVRHLIGASSWY